MATRAKVFATQRLLHRPDARVDAGGFVVEGGEVRRVCASLAAVRRAASRAGVGVTDLGEGVVTPGLVCAHAHLELSFLRGAIPGGLPMFDWVREVLAHRAVSPRVRRRAAERGAAELLAGGTTLVGDIASDFGGADLATPFRRVVFRELLDGNDPERTRGALASVSRALPRRSRRLEGLSPHGPHTASPGLLAAAGELARRRRAAVQVHWSESPEETEWLTAGTGPFGRLLGPSPGRTGLDRLADAGLLDERTSLVHGNHPGRGEPSRIADAGATVVHCPGSHGYFGRGAFPWRRYASAGVELALGTDSLASNDALDMRRELALARATLRGASPERLWTMATAGGARALGLAGRAGVLAPGAWADFVRFDASGDDVLDLLTAGEPPVSGVWIGARRVPLEGKSS